eukprot:364541-Chlamydomonas_euryale.AAC.5
MHTSTPSAGRATMRGGQSATAAASAAPPPARRASRDSCDSSDQAAGARRPTAVKHAAAGLGACNITASTRLHAADSCNAAMDQSRGGGGGGDADGHAILLSGERMPEGTLPAHARVCHASGSGCADVFGTERSGPPGSVWKTRCVCEGVGLRMWKTRSRSESAEAAVRCMRCTNSYPLPCMHSQTKPQLPYQFGGHLWVESTCVVTRAAWKAAAAAPAHHHACTA